jgi:hypothetical protein
MIQSFSHFVAGRALSPAVLVRGVLVHGVLIGTVLVGAVLVGARDVSAERLVLRDGSEIQTRGPWKVKGRQVVFTLPSGTLSALRLGDVDLEASKVAREAFANEAATNRADGQVAPVGAARPREPVWVITDRDIPRAQRPRDDQAVNDSPGLDDEASTPQGTPSAGRDVIFAATGLEVAGWRTIHSARGGVEITGVLANRSDQLVAEASIRVSVIAGDGTERTYSAEIGNATLGAGQQSPFRILLPDVVAVDDSLSFDVKGRAVRPRILPSIQPADDADAGGGGDAATEGGV